MRALRTKLVVLQKGEYVFLLHKPLILSFYTLNFLFTKPLYEKRELQIGEKFRSCQGRNIQNFKKFEAQVRQFGNQSVNNQSAMLILQHWNEN